MSLFITFEGGEGSGKSVQTRALYRKLCRLDIPAILIHEPAARPLGERLTRLLKWAQSTKHLAAYRTDAFQCLPRSTGR